jgi:hypothetical protein
MRARMRCARQRPRGAVLRSGVEADIAGSTLESSAYSSHLDSIASFRDELGLGHTLTVTRTRLPRSGLRPACMMTNPRATYASACMTLHHSLLMCMLAAWCGESLVEF